MATALEYLALVPGEASADTAVLRDRIFRSGAPGVAAAAPAPPFPFISEEVPVLAQQAPAPVQPVQQQQQQQAAPSHAHGARSSKMGLYNSQFPGVVGSSRHSPACAGVSACPACHALGV